MKTKIIWAWSIGNHLTQACRSKWWDVLVTDIDSLALKRMKNEIYPNRYGCWDEKIELCLSGKEKRGEYDIVFVWTPPDVRLKIAEDVLVQDSPRILQLEKIVANPDLKTYERFLSVIDKYREKVITIVGYDHAVSQSFNQFIALLRKEKYSGIKLIEVNFREHWSGIFKAHPWLNWPSESYFWFTSRWWWAACEHSHALHLLVYFLDYFSDDILGIDSSAKFRKSEDGSYDQEFILSGKSRNWVDYVCRQDVITTPAQKEFKVHFSDGTIGFWQYGFEWNSDKVSIIKNWICENIIFQKSRKDDFINEINHIDGLYKWEIPQNISPLRLELASKVLKIISQALATS